MSVQIQRRGDTTAAHSTFIGADRETTIDTDKRTIVVHDGKTAGGFPMAREDFSNLPPTTWEIVRAFLENKLAGTILIAPLDILEGCLLCDGAAVSRMGYSRLFARLGTTFGVGDGETTFNIPDYRGCFLRGRGGNSAIDFATLQLDAAPNITGNFNGKELLNGFNSSDGSLFRNNVNSGFIATGVAGTDYGLGLDASRSSLSYGRNNTTEVRPTNRAVNFFIKY